MNSNVSPYIVCHNGVFILPDAVFHSLAAAVLNGFVYLREDDDVLTISASRIEGGRRRLLNNRYRSAMFRDATRLAIVDLKESIRVMAIERRVSGAAQARNGSPPAAPSASSV